MTKPATEDAGEVRNYYDRTELPLSKLRRVTVNRPGSPQEAFALRLPSEVVEELRRQAEARHVGVTQLVREWVTERLAVERGRPEGTDPLLWDRTRAAVESMLPEIAARVAVSSGSA
ncbi:MAG: hypothetical protein ACYCXN_10250 [Acidimicrobiales bacterium]|jgi:hypothetical protein